MKPWYRRWYIILVFVVIIMALFTLPYTIPLISQTIYSDGERLGFYGNIIGATTTLATLFLMIQFTVNNQKKEHRKAIMPQLQTEFLYEDIDADGIFSTFDNHASFIQYLDDDSPIEVSEDKPTILETEQTGNQDTAILRALSYAREYLLLKYIITNVGCNSAVSIKISINGHPAYSGFSLPVGERKVYFLVLSKGILTDKRRKIIIEYKYKDVASLTQYEQHESFIISIDAFSSFLKYSRTGEDTLSEPRLILTVD
jgi:hypothetical protein